MTVNYKDAQINMEGAPKSKTDTPHVTSDKTDKEEKLKGKSYDDHITTAQAAPNIAFIKY